ncbi:hypothetical protein EMG21_33110, partial [Klebsiella pneumoniae]
ITSTGGVIRTRSSEIKQSGRATMGVRLMNLTNGNHVVAIARNAEADDDDEDGAIIAEEDGTAADGAEGSEP